MIGILLIYSQRYERYGNQKLYHNDDRFA